MGFLARPIIAFVGNLTALMIATRVIEGFALEQNPRALLTAAGLLTLINLTIRPVLKLFLSPLIILSLGLFSIAINAALLFMLDYFLASLTIKGLLPLLAATLLMSFVNIIIHFSARRIR